MGLVNLGNTCYMNAALQCLIHIPQLISYSSMKSYKDYRPSTCVAELINLVQSSGDNSSEYVSEKPSNLKYYMGKKYTQFSGDTQQDSFEFLLDLIELCCQESNRVVQKEPYRELPQTSRPLNQQVN